MEMTFQHDWRQEWRSSAIWIRDTNHLGIWRSWRVNRRSFETLWLWNFKNCHPCCAWNIKLAFYRNCNFDSYLFNLLISLFCKLVFEGALKRTADAGLMIFFVGGSTCQKTTFEPFFVGDTSSRSYEVFHELQGFWTPP